MITDPVLKFCSERMKEIETAAGRNAVHVYGVERSREKLEMKYGL